MCIWVNGFAPVLDEEIPQEAWYDFGAAPQRELTSRSVASGARRCRHPYTAAFLHFMLSSQRCEGGVQNMHAW